MTEETWNLPRDFADNPEAPQEDWEIRYTFTVNGRTYTVRWPERIYPSSDRDCDLVFRQVRDHKVVRLHRASNWHDYYVPRTTLQRLSQPPALPDVEDEEIQ